MSNDIKYFQDLLAEMEELQSIHKGVSITGRPIVAAHQVDYNYLRDSLQKLEEYKNLFKVKIDEINGTNFFEEFKTKSGQERITYFTSLNQLGASFESLNSTWLPDFVEWSNDGGVGDDPDDIMSANIRRLVQAANTNNPKLFEEFKKIVNKNFEETNQQIAKYRVELSSLAKQLGIGSEKSKQTSEQVESQEPPAAKTKEVPPQKASEQLDLYTVEARDTLGSIAKAHGTTWQELQKLNPQIKNINLIYPGQMIRLKPSASEQKPAPQQTNAPAAKDKATPAAGQTPAGQTPAGQTPAGQVAPAGQEAPAAQAPVAGQTPEAKKTQEEKRQKFFKDLDAASEALVTALQSGDEGYDEAKLVSDTIGRVAAQGSLKNYLDVIKNIQSKDTSAVDALDSVDSAIGTLQIKELAQAYMKRKKFQKSDWDALKELEDLFWDKNKGKYQADLKLLRAFIDRRSKGMSSGAGPFEIPDLK